MSKLIIKSPYIKSGSGAGGYMKYIATRDGVEKLSQPGMYMGYIATRPGAERRGSHGLFSDNDGVDLAKAMDELSHHEGRVWTHIISLRQEDAARLGFDNAATWRNLLKTHRNDIAAAMKISPNNFRWYAAFHNEGEHPHVHMMAWSNDPKQGFLTEIGIRDIKSVLTNDIFKQEMLFLYERKSVSRDELVREARQSMAKLARRISASSCDLLEVEKLMGELASKLGSVSGKKQYGYLPKSVKRVVDEIVGQLEQLPAVAEFYEKWWQLNEQVHCYYSGEAREKPPLSQQKEFRAIKNAIIQEAEQIRLSEISFENTPQQGGVVRESSTTPVTAAIPAAARLLHHLSRMFEDNSKAMAHTHSSGLRIDSKRRHKLMEKKMALGLRQEHEMRME